MIKTTCVCVIRQVEILNGNDDDDNKKWNDEVPAEKPFSLKPVVFAQARAGSAC
jgi:hypothetical protein